MSTADEVRMQIAYGADRISPVKQMMRESLNESFNKLFEIMEKPIHTDVTRKGKWIRTKYKRYKAPLWFDPMEEMDIHYGNSV